MAVRLKFAPVRGRGLFAIWRSKPSPERSVAERPAVFSSLSGFKLLVMLLYAITDRHLGAAAPEEVSFPPLLSLVEGWAAGGVQFIQLREKDLDHARLELSGRQIKAKLGPQPTKLLVNLSSPELAAIALKAGADGVHLAGKPTQGATAAVRAIFPAAIISMPCHSLEEVESARDEGADVILFSPIFEKTSAQPQGLEQLRLACAIAQPVPVFALGGVTTTNAAACLAAGAAGVAGIRLFAEDDWRRLARQTQPIEPYIVE